MRLFVHFYCRTAVYCALRNSKELKISYDWRGTGNFKNLEHSNKVKDAEMWK